jgi:hypothetical protein
LRKAVPVALVLIAGAAVILWFGNRLNSWILGGLIGGLASLLLSIPISLTLFAYFARQRDEDEQYPQVVRKRLPSRRRSSPLPHEIDAGYYDDECALVDGEISTIVEEPYQPPNVGRDSGWLDEEFGSPIPPAGQLPPTASSRRTTGHMPSRHLSAPYGMQQRKTTPVSHQADDAEEEYRTRKTTVRRTAYPGLPSSHQTSFRSRFRSNALHTARLEAAQQHMEENDTSIEDYDEPSISPAARSRRGREARTDHLLPDAFTEDIHKPLQRRAPYTYEDDEVRQETSLYREAPLVRRSSRYVRGRKNQDQAQ